MKTVSVSVIIPTCNGEAFIAEAINSVISQTYPILEIFLIDDGSTDQTKEIIKKFSKHLRLIKQSHLGDPAFGRNRGIREAKGEFIAFLDQDDLWPEDKLHIQVDNLERYPDAEVDVGITKVLNQRSDKNNASDFGRFNEFDQYFFLASGLFRKDVFDRIGMFDENMKYHGSDFDWILRAAEAGVLFNLHNEITLLYRLHMGNYSNNPVKLKLGIVEVFKKSLIRRKRKGNGSFAAFPKLKTAKD